MKNFVELTHYKMINELCRNPDANITIVRNNPDGSLTLFEITKDSPSDVLKSVILSHDDVHIFMREEDYGQMCIDSYKKE